MPTVGVGPDAKRNLQDIADILAKSKKVVVITGAGISTNSGIPVRLFRRRFQIRATAYWAHPWKHDANPLFAQDFRSENGLYSLIQAQYDAATHPMSGLDELTRCCSTPDVDQEHSDARITSSQESSSSNARRDSKLPTNIKGRELFDSLVWFDPLSTSIFYTFIASLRKKIRDEVRQTTPTHRFIRTLRDGGRLVRCYTQNIDGLESRDGLCTDMSRGRGNRARFSKKVLSKPRPDSSILPGGLSDGGCEVVQLHGDLNDLRCSLCSRLCSWEEDGRETTLLQGEAPDCQDCAAKDEDRRNRGKRGTAVGTLRPNVVLYGEEHPTGNLLSPITAHDLGLAPDLLLILGTSLKVHGLKVLVKEFARSVHARPGGKGKVIFVNRTKPPESVWSEIIDFWVGMDCDDWVHDLRERRMDIWERQGTLHLPIIKQVSPKSAKAKPESQTSRNPVAWKDKENVTVEVEVRSKESKSKPRSSKIPAPKKDEVKKTGQKAAKSKPRAKKGGPLSAVSTAAINIIGPPRRQIKQPTVPTTPKRKPGSTDEDISNQQLVTPPTSGRSQAIATRPLKRKMSTSSDEDALLASPSRRKKRNLQIWVDSEVKHITSQQPNGLAEELEGQ
ncbi:MAG: hypothetical protein M1837_002493 [Sclerophora amabilis]|nr:MAG: hypothetical protein M1837_002493 [Sclerophora amabilis]